MSPQQVYTFGRNLQKNCLFAYVSAVWTWSRGP